jgi:hypothetical protein
VILFFMHLILWSHKCIRWLNAGVSPY